MGYIGGEILPVDNLIQDQEESTNLNIRISVSFKELITEYAKKKGITVSELVKRSIINEMVR